MIGSPDLVAFTKETDFSEIDPSALPEELSVPMYPYTGDITPWSRMSGANFKKDFILLSEFSEQVGPQPLLTVPSETKACGTFDLNHFSLRIMSVDYQTSLASPAGCGSLKLNFVEDSKVVLGDSREGVFAYVHHLTLYDLEARGFVRPFCLAYVSSDENKIIQQFQQLSTEFSRVSECLKTGNRKNFANELEIKLRNLEYTRVMLLREKERELNNASVKCTNEREWMMNGIPTLDRNTEDVKLKECETEIKFQKDGCGISGKAEVECENENRSCITHEKDKQVGDRRKDKQGNRSFPMPLANKEQELATVEKSIQDYKSLLKQVTCYPTRKLRNSEYSPYEPDDLPHSLELDLDDLKHDQLAGPMLECNVFTYTNTPSHSSRFDKRLKSLEELCDDYFHQQALQQLYSIERTFRGDICHLYTQQLCRNLLRNLKSTNFLFEDPCDLEVAGLQTGIAGQHSVRQPSFLPAPSILSEPVSLESYASCVEMVPIKLELGGSSQSPVVPSSVNTPSEDSLPLTSDTAPVEAEMENEGAVSALDSQENVEYVSALMKTSISSGDSIEVLGTEKSFRSQGSNLPMDTAMQRPPPLSTTAALECLRQGRVPTRRTCSEDSIEVLSTTESILPEELRASYPCAIDEEIPEQENDEKDMRQKQDNKNAECVLDVGNVPGDHGGACLLEQQGFYPAVTLTPPDCPITLTLGGSSSQDACHVTESLPFSLLDEPCRTEPDDLSDCFSYLSTTASTTSECPFSVCLPGDKREGGTRRRRGRVGRAALQFLRQFPFAVHAVFSLLSGRTLVVLGNEEAAVRRLVTALSVYVPHLSRYRDSIQPWTSTPLQLTDLLNWKLIGFNRTCCFTHTNLPHCLGHYSRYLSVLDVDQKTLRCPTYSGTLINLLVDPRSQFKRGNTYFMFAQSVQSKLVTRAFLLTFLHGHHTTRRPWENTRTERFLSEFHKDDKKILNYLSELIKLNFMEIPPNILRFSYTTSSIFKL
ncbi:Guanine nucleotide exchange protein smcr8b [Anabarilius grahami]|uniref:Guanine nucleotide exchange protein smcr8b n=1 Tax=Anabarilius grahami TaxID=495550 RepID=A0A3N0XL56_ANAGA|nr:Guanine nucleotide exchange protein smcr8b [Anabarilius grahami]